MSNDNVIPFPGGAKPASRDEIRQLANQFMDDAGGPHAALTLLQQWMGGLAQAHVDETTGRRQPVLLPRRAERVRFTVRLDLDNVKPPIWRRLRLASDLTLSQLHEIVQVAMGWADSHLHHFLMGPGPRDWRVVPFITAFDIDEGEEGVPEDAVRLDQVLASPGDRLYYEYDFGDSWTHTIRLESVDPWAEGDPDAVCVTGRRACPPEDVGGVWGYQEMLDALAGRNTSDADPEERRQFIDWLPDDYDPAAFSVDEVNEQLTAGALPPLTEWHPMLADLLHRHSGSPLSSLGTLIKQATASRPELTDDDLSAAVGPYQHLLDVIGDGVRLTNAGYLPPSIVQEIYLGLDIDRHWIGAGNRENQTFPVLQLRESATEVGLLRKQRGDLLPVKAARQHLDDPRWLFDRIASRLPLGRPHERDAGLVVLLHIAAGQPDDPEQSPGAILHQIGWRADGGTTDQAALVWARPTIDVLNVLAGRSSPFSDRPIDQERRTMIARALLRPKMG